MVPGGGPVCRKELDISGAGDETAPYAIFPAYPAFASDCMRRNNYGS